MTTDKLVLFRDTNAWCPYCARVWFALEEKGIPYDTVLIDLQNKPEWYTSLVPTNLVPAISLERGKTIIWESKDVLLALEEQYPEVPLLPTAAEAREQALALLAEIEAATVDRAGFAFMTGGRPISRNVPASSEPLPALGELKAAFEEKLAFLEEKLAADASGPYLLGSKFSLLDIMCISFMDRLAAGLPKFRGFQLRGNPAYPAIGAWFDAIRARPAYQFIASDDQTLQLLFGRMMGLTPSLPPPSKGAAPSADADARMQAAGLLSASFPAVVAYVLAESGITRYQASPYGATTRSLNGHQPRVAPAVREAVEFQVERIINTLNYGVPGARAERTAASAIGAAAAAFLRGNAARAAAGASLPLPLGGLDTAAAAALGAAADTVLAQTYADGADPYPDAAAAAAAGDAAALEAAAKLTANRGAIVADILLNSGLARPNACVFGSTYRAVNGYSPVISPAVKDAVEDAVGRVAGVLRAGTPGAPPAAREARAVGAAGLAFFRNRASAPRDMSAAAAERFRAACDLVLRRMYVDEPLAAE